MRNGNQVIAWAFVALIAFLAVSTADCNAQTHTLAGVEAPGDYFLRATEDSEGYLSFQVWRVDKPDSILIYVPPASAPVSEVGVNWGIGAPGWAPCAAGDIASGWTSIDPGSPFYLPRQEELVRYAGWFFLGYTPTGGNRWVFVSIQE